MPAQTTFFLNYVLNSIIFMSLLEVLQVLLSSPHLTSPHLTSPHLASSPHLTSSSPHLTSHLASPPPRLQVLPLLAFLCRALCVLLYNTATHCCGTHNNAGAQTSRT